MPNFMMMFGEEIIEILGHPAAQTLVLIATAILIYRYVRAAHRSAKAAEHLNDATLAAQAALWVMEDSIHEHDHEDSGWFLVDICNMGPMRAAGVTVCASWDPCGYAGAKQPAVIPLEPDKLSGDPSPTWRAQYLEPDESRKVRFPCVPAEGKCGRVIPATGRLPAIGLVWHAPNYTKWTSCVVLQWDAEENRWTTNLRKSKPLREAQPKYWPQSQHGPLPPSR